MYLLISWYYKIVTIVEGNLRKTFLGVLIEVVQQETEWLLLKLLLYTGKTNNFEYYLFKLENEVNIC